MRAPYILRYLGKGLDWYIGHAEAQPSQAGWPTQPRLRASMLAKAILAQAQHGGPPMLEDAWLASLGVGRWSVEPTPTGPHPRPSHQHLQDFQMGKARRALQIHPAVGVRRLAACCCWWYVRLPPPQFPGSIFCVLPGGSQFKSLIVTLLERSVRSGFDLGSVH